MTAIHEIGIVSAFDVTVYELRDADSTDKFWHVVVTDGRTNETVTRHYASSHYSPSDAASDLLKIVMMGEQ